MKPHRLFAMFLVLAAETAAFGLGFLDEALQTPTGMVGKPYRHQLKGRAGSPPYHFKIDSGKLPPGVTLSTNGLISGIPTASGIYKIWANLGDSWGKHSERQASITVFDAQPPKPNPLDKPGWKLTWHDEFDAAELDRQRWKTAYPGNPAQPANLLIRDGVLHLRIDKENPSANAGANLRASGIESRVPEKPFAQQYGWFEMRARTTRGSGLLAAFCLLPLDRDYGKLQSDGGTRGRPVEAAEIDIFEQLGRETNANNHTVHFGRSLSDSRQSEHRRIDLPFSPQDDFHIYALQWNAKALVWYIDGLELHRSDKTPQSPFFLRVTLYEGESKWRGEVGASVPYPKDFEIDYVRVYSSGEAAGR